MRRHHPLRALGVLLLLGAAWGCGGPARNEDSAAKKEAAASSDSPLWAVETVEKGGDTGLYSSLALDAAGNPHIAYFDQMNTKVKHAWREGGAWRFEEIDKKGGALAMALDGQGKPMITYTRMAPGEMSFARFDGAANKYQLEKVDETGFPTYSAIRDGAGRLHVAYRDYTGTCANILKHAIYDGKWKIEKVDPDSCSGQAVSIALSASGEPRISYNRDYPDADLYFAHHDGGSWHLEKVDTQGNVGRYSALGLDGQGLAHIAYYADGQLKYASQDGKGGWKFEIIDPQKDVGFYTSMKMGADGVPHIGYWDVTHGDLKYATFRDGAWKVETVDSKGKVGLYTSLVLDAAGRPQISYYDSTTRSLKLAHRKE